MNHDGQVDLSDLQMMLTTLGDQNGDGKVRARARAWCWSLCAPACERARAHVSADREAGAAARRALTRRRLPPRCHVLVSFLGQIDMMDLPEGARNNLLQAVQGVQSATQTDRATRLAAIQARLSATPAGQQILRGLDTNGDNQLSPQELATAWASL
eukprot:7376394-Prymnesium_polylepis.4